VGGTGEELGVDCMSRSAFIDASELKETLRRIQDWAPKGEAAKFKVLSTRVDSISILGAISVKNLIKINLKKPISFPKKRRLACDEKQQIYITVTNHYINIIRNERTLFDYR
jgi:hypothetical protein